MLKAKALKIAHYDFEDKKGKKVKTSKLIVSLGAFGNVMVCTELANEYDVFTELSVIVESKDNKLSIKSIEK